MSTVKEIAMSVAKQNPDLIDRLNAAQNALDRPIDIMTFAYFKGVTQEQLERHVAYYEEMVANQPVRRRRKAA